MARARRGAVVSMLGGLGAALLCAAATAAAPSPASLRAPAASPGTPLLSTAPRLAGTTQPAVSVGSGGSVSPGWQSENWSGYAVTGTGYTSVSGTWTVPAVQPGATPTYSVTWMGLDGFESSDPSLIQVGTEQNTVNGATSYGAWWTTSSAGYTTRPFGQTVEPGDAMSAVIQQIWAGRWSIAIADETQGWNTGVQVAFDGPGDSAEWIMEAPEVNGQPSTLANYTTFAFDKCTLDGASPGFVYTEAGDMVPPGSSFAESSPSAPNVAADGFNVAYGYTPPLPPDF